MTGNPGLNDPALNKEVSEYARKQRTRQRGLGAGIASVIFGFFMWLSRDHRDMVDNIFAFSLGGILFGGAAIIGL